MSDNYKLDEIIENEGESTYVDFKKEYYNSNNPKNQIEKIKDIMAMANSHTQESSRYIIFGVNLLEDEEKRFSSVRLEDVANLEDLIQNNVEPEIKIKLYTYKYKGHNLGILEIFECVDRPYIVKKDYKSIRQGEALIRSGTRTRPMGRKDYDRIYDLKKGIVSTDNVKLGFDSANNRKKDITIKSRDRENLPSEKRKKYLQEKLDILQEYKNKEDLKVEFEEKVHPIIAMNKKIAEMSELIRGPEISDGKIRTGYSNLNMPIYRDENELEELIENIDTDFSQEDNYYIQENIAQDLNFTLMNTDDEFLNDVYIELIIPKKIGEILPYNIEKIKIGGMYNFQRALDLYPKVEIQDSNYIVDVQFEIVRHHMEMDLFPIPLKIVYNSSSVNEVTKLKYTISAKQLKKPINRDLDLKLTK